MPSRSNSGDAQARPERRPEAPEAPSFGPWRYGKIDTWFAAAAAAAAASAGWMTSPGLVRLTVAPLAACGQTPQSSGGLVGLAQVAPHPI